LLESTNINSTNDYIEKALAQDLIAFKNGELKSKSYKNQKKWISSEELKKIDKEKLQEIVNFRSFEVANLENADTWLDSIDKKPIKRLSESKPDLPL
jgi:hypothetical protein